MTSKNNDSHIEPENELPSSALTDDQKQHIEPLVDSELKNVSEDLQAEPIANSTSESAASNAEPPLKREQEKKPSQKLGALALVISLLSSAGLGGFAFYSHQKESNYQAQIDALQASLSTDQSSFNAGLSTFKQEMLDKISEMNNHSTTALNQQKEVVANMQLALAKDKGTKPNDWLLAEVDYLMKLAGRKLFLEHDVATASRLIENADQRIAELNDASLVDLRRAMANDIATLRSIKKIDRDGIVLRLTSLQQQIDKLPLSSTLLPEENEEIKAEVSGDISNWKDNLMTSLNDFSSNFISFRVRDGDVAPLLSPQQHFYLKENLKAKLENAIKAVYSEQQEVYQLALTTAEEWTLEFFKQDDHAVTEFVSALAGLNKQEIQVEYPEKLEAQNKLDQVITKRLSSNTVPTEEE